MSFKIKKLHKVSAEQRHVDFLSGSKVTGSCGEFIWHMQRERGDGEQKGDSAEPQSSSMKWEGKHEIKMHKLQFELDSRFQKPAYFV